MFYLLKYVGTVQCTSVELNTSVVLYLFCLLFMKCSMYYSSGSVKNR